MSSHSITKIVIKNRVKPKTQKEIEFHYEGADGG